MQSGINNIYEMGVLKRNVIIWAVFQIILWAVFGIAYSFNVNSWGNVSGTEYVAANSDGLLKTFFIIIINNLILFSFIVLGNVFVRFHLFTPGLLILLLQGVMIGWVAGSNSFEFPFASVSQANIQYLKVGLWETTAYALACAVTLTKSLNIADTFPAKQWSKVRKIKEISLSVAEKRLFSIGILLLIISAYVEAVLITIV